MLTLAMPQSLPRRGEEHLGLAQVGGEDRRRQALRHVVVQRDRLVERLVGEHVEDRREGLVAHRRRSARGISRGPGAHRRRRAPSPRARARRRGPAALRPAPRASAACMPSKPRSSISGPTSVPCCQRIADRHRAVDCLQPLDQRVGDVVDDQAAQGGAALARGADRGEGDGARGQLQVGARRDDHRVVAAELEQRAAEAFGDAAAPTLAAHAGAAGGADQRDQRRCDQGLADVAAADQDLRSGPRATSGRFAEARIACSSSAWQARAVSGVFSEGFQTTLSPQTRASARVPRPDGDREVEGGDDADHAERVPRLHHAVAGPLGGDASARRAGATGRRRSRRCRSSPGPRRGPPERILPVSSVTRRPSASLCRRSSSPSRRTSSPRSGAGTMRQARKAWWARPMATSASALVASPTKPCRAPSMGERTGSPSATRIRSSTPRVVRMSVSFMMLSIRYGRRC